MLGVHTNHTGWLLIGILIGQITGGGAVYLAHLYERHFDLRSSVIMAQKNAIAEVEAFLKRLKGNTPP